MGEKIKTYDQTFYDFETRTAIKSAEEVLPIFFSLLKKAPLSVVDIGCGTGAWLHKAQALGVFDVLGLDGEYVQKEMLLIPQDRFMATDLTSDFKINKHFDLAICLEVAEHISSKYSENLIKNLTKLSDLILFSAAIPGQGGTHHINEQWPSFWFHYFKKFGFIMLDILRPEIWENENVSWWYRQNIFVVCKHDKINSLLRNIMLPKIWTVC